MEGFLGNGHGRSRSRPGRPQPGRPQPGRVDGRGRNRQTGPLHHRVDGRHGSQNIGRDNSRQGTSSRSKAVSADAQILENRKRYSINLDRQMLITEEDVLLFGLSYVGFGEERQNVRVELNTSRFKSHFGVEPRTIKDLLVDLKEEFSGGIIYRDVFMTLNWLKLYDEEHVLAGRWKYGEKHIGYVTKDNARKIQSLKCKIIVFGGFFEGETIWISVDGVNYPTQEFRTTPHAFDTKYYDHKSNGPGLKYEYALALRRQKCVLMRGPMPAGEMHDGTVFCGGSLDIPKESRDQEALYFKLPEGKKAIGDSAYKNIPEKVTTFAKNKEAKDFINRAKARQESYHARLKCFHVLSTPFRHGMSPEEKMKLHKMCAEAVSVVVGFDLKYHPLMEL